MTCSISCRPGDSDRGVGSGRGNRGRQHRRRGRRTAPSVVQTTGVEEFLDALRSSLKDRSFRPLPVRERMIPKADGKLRRLGIGTVTA